MTAVSIGDGEGAFAHGTLGVVVARPSGRLLRANAVFEAATGLDLAARPDLTLADVFDEGVDVSALVSILKRFSTGARILASRSVPFRRWSDGVPTVRQAEIGLVDWCDGAGDDDRAYLVLSFLDITALRAPDASLDNHVRNAKARYKDIYENIAEGIYRSSLDGIQLSANPALVRMNECESEGALLAKANDVGGEWYVDPDRRAAFRTILHTHGFVRDFVSQVYRLGTRERIWISENARIVRDPESGEPLCYEGSIRDVTATVALLHETAKLDKIAAQAPGCLFALRREPGGHRHVTYASAGIEALVGITAAEMVADIGQFERRVHPDDRRALVETIETSAAGMTPWRTEFRMRRVDGADVWIGSHALPELDADGTIVWHGFLSDVTPARNAQERMESLAFTDALTGLPNRQMLRERAYQELAASDRTGEYGAVLFIDLDGFKRLNDNHGHDAGDKLLVAIARRLEECLRASDVVARLGGDEFIVLLTHLSRDPAEAVRRAEAVAEKIRAAVGRPYDLGHCDFQTSSSVGLELFQGRAVDFDTLMRRADTAMYRAKSTGRNRVCRYDPAPRTAPTVENDASDMRRAIEEGRLALHVQPVVDPRGTVRGGEALLRWLHPRHGPTPPLELLENAVPMGLSARLHQWVLREACDVLAGWLDDPAMRGLDLSINLAAEQIESADFAQELIAVLAASGARADNLVLEVAEHAVLEDVDAATATMAQLQRRGLRFSLDNVGTGAGSLAGIGRLPVDALKIDRASVQALDTERDAHVRVAASILAARRRGLAVIGEGVETASQAKTLVSLGAEGLQGYHFAEPLTVADFREFVVESGRADLLRQAG